MKVGSRLILVLTCLGLLLLCFLVNEARGGCPRAVDLQPCICTSVDDNEGDEIVTITCTGLTSEEQVANTLRASRGYEIFAFDIEFSDLRYLPHDAFEGTHINVVSVRNSSLLSLTDTDTAFVGLEKSLHFLEMEDCSFANAWDWSQLRLLELLTEVRVSGSDLVYVTRSLSSISHLELEVFSFPRNSITGLEDKTFAPFTGLQSLYLDNNLISELKRDVFPSPTAPKLQVLGLSYNKLISLPKDLFSEMPILKSLYLSGNTIYTLDEKTFKPIWNHIAFFFFYDTPLVCDCRLKWISLSDNKRKYIHSVCRTPSHLTGRNLDSLMTKELWC